MSPDAGGRFGPAGLGALAVVLASAAVSLLAYGTAPARLDWGVPGSPPAALVLAAFPALAAGLFVGLPAVERVLARRGSPDGTRRRHRLSTVVALAAVVLAQVAVVLAALW